MKKIKIIKAEMIPSPHVKNGDVRSFQEKIADSLIKKGIAEPYEEKKPVKKAVKKADPEKKAPQKRTRKPRKKAE